MRILFLPDADLETGKLSAGEHPVIPLSIRVAREADLPALAALMARSIDLLDAFLSPEQVRASHAVMGLDSQLVRDGSYFIVEEAGVLAGCGGWSRRATLYGGDHSDGRDAAILDPAKDAARVRAMYTDPAFTRRGIGRLVLDHCEAAARREGFGRAELMATLGGEPLYCACGYIEIERTAARVGNVDVPLIRMGKVLG